MALGSVMKSVARFFLLLNLCMYAIVGAIAGWALNSALDHTYSTGHGRSHPVGFSPLYFPMGNEATGFMIIFALIAAVVGASSCLSGIQHLRVWTAQSLASSTASSMTAWALTLLALGLVIKEIHIGHVRNTKLKTLESFIIILCGTKLFYILLIHAGFFGGNYCSYEDTYVATITTTAEPQKGRTTVASSV